MSSLPIYAQIPMIVGDLHTLGLSSFTQERQSSLRDFVQNLSEADVFVSGGRGYQIGCFKQFQQDALQCLQQGIDSIVLANALSSLCGTLTHYSFLTSQRPADSSDLIKKFPKFADWILNGVRQCFPDVASIKADLGTGEGLDAYFSSRATRDRWAEWREKPNARSMDSFEKNGQVLADLLNQSLTGILSAADFNNIDMMQLPQLVSLPQEDVDALKEAIPIICDVMRLVGVALCMGGDSNMSLANSFWNSLSPVVVVRWRAFLDVASQLEKNIPPASA